MLVGLFVEGTTPRRSCVAKINKYTSGGWKLLQISVGSLQVLPLYLSVGRSKVYIRDILEAHQ
jgi:hypothetical protein